MKFLSVIQHTSSDYLGHMEDHLEGRRIRFTYSRPFTETGTPPDPATVGDGLVLLGGGPWGSAGTRNVPTLDQEVAVARSCLMMDIPIFGIGLGAQILALAADGSTETMPLEFRAGYATRTQTDALNGFLPERFPCITYQRDRAVPPAYAQILAEDESGQPALFQIGKNAFGFAGHPGFKLAMAEDLIMEFEEGPSNDTGPEFAKAQAMKTEIGDSLVQIMTGLVQITGWMRS